MDRHLGPERTQIHLRPNPAPRSARRLQSRQPNPKNHAAEREIRASGDTVFSDRDVSHTAHHEVSLPLDGAETTLGPITLSFKPIDDSTFQILTKLEDFTEVSNFKFSPTTKP